MTAFQFHSFPHPFSVTVKFTVHAMATLTGLPDQDPFVQSMYDCSRVVLM